MPEREIYNFLVNSLPKLGQHLEVHRHNVSRDNLLSLVAIGCGLALTSEATTSACFRGLVY